MKKLDDYTVVIAPNGAEFFAYLPAVPGCWVVAETPARAREELEVAFALFVDVWREYGDTPPDDISVEALLAVG